MTPYLDAGDVRLYLGDAATVLADLPEGSVDCCVTSPPYFGLRDYGTATWEGGDPACDHMRPLGGGTTGFGGWSQGPEKVAEKVEVRRQGYRGTCGKCGAVRHDVQIGLEPTPEEYVAALVAVFRQVWRVLAPWGTCFVNLGDGYQGKQLLMMPARLALALQADGWWVRSRICWTKPNPMPESVTDRPTSAHEDVYLLTKAPRYYYDAEAVREDYAMTSWTAERESAGDLARGREGIRSGEKGAATPEHRVRAADRRMGATALTNGGYTNTGRNLRNVWSIATEPTPEAHFATFPLELVRRCLAAGCPERVCRECGEPSRRIVEREGGDAGEFALRPGVNGAQRGSPEKSTIGVSGRGSEEWQKRGTRFSTTGWTDCGHENAYRPGVVLDPFVGSGKTCQQARRMGLHAVGIDASEEYLGITQVRLLADRARRWIAPGPSIAPVDDQLSLLGGVA